MVPGNVVVINTDDSDLFFPPFKHGKELAHRDDGLLACVAFALFVAELFVVLCAGLDHLLHCALLGESTLLVAVDTVFGAGFAFGFRAEVFGSLHRHAAAFAKFHLFFHGVFTFVIGWYRNPI